MGRWTAGTAVLLIFGLLALAASGCGSDSSSGATGSTTESASTGEGSKEFLIPGESNKQAKFGQEGDSSELEQVAQIVEESFDAREAKDWAGQCATLSKKAIKVLEENPASLGQKGCPKALEAQGKPAPKNVLENNMAGPVAAFRAKGKQGYALYHGTDKKDYAVPMDKEGDEWKVGALTAEEIPNS